MTLEGVLGPNTTIDDAAGIKVEAPQALCVVDDALLLLSSGNTVLAISRWGDEPRLWCSFDQPVTALCASPAGAIGIGLADGSFAVRDKAGSALAGWGQPEGLASVTDCLFLSEEEIAIVDSGYRAGEDILSRAPWDEAGRGQVVAISRNGATRQLAAGLHCPMGLARDAGGELIVSLLERAAIVDLAGKVRQSGFPAYLGRIRATGTGYLLSCLSRRDPLIEFLKTETEFVAEMKATIDPRHWLSPRANPEFSHDFPIELGATRLFGEIKPWAPSFSYGLVLATDKAFIPTSSAHSRANGARHAISDAVEWNGDVIAVSRASGEVLRFSIARESA
ncbi:hypothetical protein LL06_09980 [Hoeflea sp. BAL378]|uniref:hypothetical protein n=1 Tax=Hoeflea sp. BAL378 TaxID=1547437 RepID=UPI000513E89A|nr:hypothetical protein [Hoeflea sp. BAL378]KGF69603.1 hypothetical protein LL06_09980 [Hoeflea sp. BAL378]